MILKEVKSGTIDIESNGFMLMLQFNCNCDDVLPYCQAMCCKMRMGYNAMLTDEEAERLGHVDVVKDNSVFKFLPHKADYSCIHLENDRCKVHDQKPRMCMEEHCSPRGNMGDPTIKRRFGGWLLLPNNPASFERPVVQKFI